MSTLAAPASARPWRVDEACPHPLDKRAHLKVPPPAGPTGECVVIGWIHTSSVHAYPQALFRGPWDPCENYRVSCNYPQNLRTYPAGDLPQAY
jgi:hypothetical protein